jgi:SAM-dependent methyltransferase
VNQTSFIESLQELAPPHQGIYSPDPVRTTTSGLGVTDQFFEDAETYDRLYSDFPRWKYLVSVALNRIPVSLRATSVIDVGSGSGNSVLPLLEILPEAHIFAVDISAPLLALLKTRVESTGHASRCTLIAADLGIWTPPPGTADLVVGGAVLHHLFDPALVIGNLASSLRNGGYAVFFEPFEPGAAVVRLLCEELISKADSLRLAPDTLDWLYGYIAEVELRSDPDKFSPRFCDKDDKWLFTRTYFERAAADFGLEIVSLTQLDDSGMPVENQVRTRLRLGGIACESLSEQFWDVVRRYDRAFSKDAKADIPPEACITLRKR